MPTFDGKSEKFELFEDLFQTSLKIHNQLTEEDKVNYFPSLMRGDALQTFRNISSRNRENLAEIPTVFRRKYVKPQSMATAKRKFQQLIFNPTNQKLIDFLDELQKLAKDAFGVAAQAIVDQFIYAKMPPHLKKSINHAHLENGTYEQIVTHLKRELELNSLEYPDETQMNTVMDKKQIEGNPDNAGNINSDTNDSKSTTTKLTENLELSTLPVRHVAKPTTPQRDVTLEPMQQTGHFPGRTNLKNRTHTTVYLVLSMLQPNILTINVTFSLRNSD